MKNLFLKKIWISPLLLLSVLTASDLKKDTVIDRFSVEEQKPSQVMVKLKAGINPSFVYTEFLKNNKLTTSDIIMVKSFPLAGKKPNKHILILESKKLSNIDLLRIAKRIEGNELVENSSEIQINPMNSIPNMDIHLDIPTADPSVIEIDDTPIKNELDSIELWEKSHPSKGSHIQIMDEGFIIEGNQNINVISQDSGTPFPEK